MKRFIKNHQEWLKKTALSPELILAHHQQKIKYLQHERLIHLLITLFFGLLLFGVSLWAAHQSYWPVLVLWLVVAVLEGFYIKHYYLLENTVQHWYQIEDELKQKL